MRKKFDEEAATDRALLVLTREARRVSEGAERVAMVVRALALRRGVISHREAEDDSLEFEP